jgi:hypothetical protein
MNWSPEQRDIIEEFTKVADWKSIKKHVRFKCNTCHSIGLECWVPLDKDGKRHCCDCGETYLVQMCPLDHCHCTETKPIDHIEYCPICKQPICPNCGTHDVTQISRVTGYYQDVGGFNEAKKQELRDRHRTTTEELK